MKSTLYAFIFLMLFNLGSQAQNKQVSFGFMYVFKKKQTDKTIEILEVVDGSDAQAKGLKTDDLILEINSKPIVNLSNDEITKEIVAAKQVGSMELKRLQDNKKITIKTSEFDRFVCLSPTCTDSFSKIKDVLNYYTYEGSLQNNLYNGQGTLTFIGKSKNHGKNKILKQTGYFKNGQFSFGKTTFDEGAFEGQLSGNLPDGQGVFTLNDGSIWDGEFRFGKLLFGVIKTFPLNKISVTPVKDGALLPVENNVESLKKYSEFENKLIEILKLSKDGFQSLLIEKNKNSNIYQKFETYKTDITINDFDTFKLEQYPTGSKKLIAVTKLSEIDARSLYQNVKNDLGSFYIRNVHGTLDYKEESSFTVRSYKLKSKDEKYGNIELKIDRAPYDIDATDNKLNYNVFLIIEKK
jgi:hypothetical protein